MEKIIHTFMNAFFFFYNYWSRNVDRINFLKLLYNSNYSIILFEIWDSLSWYLRIWQKYVVKIPLILYSTLSVCFLICSGWYDLMKWYCERVPLIYSIKHFVRSSVYLSLKTIFISFALYWYFHPSNYLIIKMVLKKLKLTFFFN